MKQQIILIRNLNYWSLKRFEAWAVVSLKKSNTRDEQFLWNICDLNFVQRWRMKMRRQWLMIRNVFLCKWFVSQTYRNDFTILHNNVRLQKIISVAATTFTTTRTLVQKNFTHKISRGLAHGTIKTKPKIKK